jgi:hypothetical protein
MFVVFGYPVGQVNVEIVLSRVGIFSCHIRQRAAHIEYQEYNALENHQSDCNPCQRGYSSCDSAIQDVEDNGNEKHPYQSV